MLVLWMNSKCLAMMLLCINDALALAAIILQYYFLSGILGQKDCLLSAPSNQKPSANMQTKCNLSAHPLSSGCVTCFASTFAFRFWFWWWWLRWWLRWWWRLGSVSFWKAWLGSLCSQCQSDTSFRRTWSFFLIFKTFFKLKQNILRLWWLPPKQNTIMLSTICSINCDLESGSSTKKKEDKIPICGAAGRRSVLTMYAPQVWRKYLNL